MKTVNHQSHLMLARATGLLLIIVCVLFQRRELLHWTELAFVVLSIGLQEAAIRLPQLKRLRTPMIATYSMLPMLLVMLHIDVIQAYSGDAVSLALYTPLPLVMVSVQIMVLYVRESARLTPVVLVLALFSSVIGVRRPTDEVLWPWLLLIGSLVAIFLALQHPVLLRYGVYAHRGIQYKGAAAGLKRAYVATLPLLGLSVAVLTLMLFFMLPRVDFDGGGPRDQVIDGDDGAQPFIPGGGPGDGGSGTGASDNNRPGRRTPPQSVSGLADEVQLGDFGRIQLNRAEVMTLNAMFADFEDRPNVYLRAYSYGEFDGMRWSRLSSRSARSLPLQPGNTGRELPEAPRFTDIGWTPRRYGVEFTREAVGREGALPLPVETHTISGYSGMLFYDSIQNTLHSVDPPERFGIGVMVNELTMPPGNLARILRRSRPSTAALPDEYWQLPDGLAEQIEARFAMYEELGDKVWSRDEGARLETQGVYAAARWLVEMFEKATVPDGTPAWQYSLEKRPAPGPDAIARFLDTSNMGDERFGHCEFFASAMVVLLRCFGVPARVAVGYLAKQPDEDGEWTVRGCDAHAWAEVYFERFGWMIFDPTPPAGRQPLPDDDTPPDTDPEPEDDDAETDPDEIVEEEDDPEIGPGERDWIRDYDRTAQGELFAGIGDFFKDMFQRADEAMLGATSFFPDVLPRSGWLRVGLIVFGPTLMLLYLLRRKRKRRKLEKQLLGATADSQSRRERGLYFQLLLLLAKYGFHKRASETPREFAMRVTNFGGDLHKPVVALTDVYYALRYGHDRASEQGFRAMLAEYASRLREADSATRKGKRQEG